MQQCSQGFAEAYSGAGLTPCALLKTQHCSFHLSQGFILATIPVKHPHTHSETSQTSDSLLTLENVLLLISSWNQKHVKNYFSFLAFHNDVVVTLVSSNQNDQYLNPKNMFLRIFFDTLATIGICIYFYYCLIVFSSKNTCIISNN